MGQASSSSSTPDGEPFLETKIRDPVLGKVKGLALVAHGRLGGSSQSAATSTLAEHLRVVHGIRVVTWNARGSGASAGKGEWSSFSSWVGDENVADFKLLLVNAVRSFAADFPGVQNQDLFICGHSAGAIYASTMRLPAGVVHGDLFKPIKYILLSYPLLPAPVLGLCKTGWYFRALEGLIGGYWEGNPEEPAADILSLTGSLDMLAPPVIYWLWTSTLQSKRRESQSSFKQIVIEGAGHVWTGHLDRIGKEVSRWIREEV